MAKIKKILKNTDSFRRKTTKKISNSISSPDKEKFNFTGTENIKKVLICRPNHRLGNQLLITPLIQEVHETFPQAKIDLFLKGNLGKVIFEKYSYVDKLLILPKKHFKELPRYFFSWIRLRRNKYDLVINAEIGSSSGRLAAQFSNSLNQFMGEEESKSQHFPDDYKHIAKKTVYQLRDFLSQSGVVEIKKEIPSLNVNLTQIEINNGKQILNQIVKNDKPTIGIYTLATSDKCYPSKYWVPFYNALKEKYEKKYNIVEVLPIENVSQIDFASLNFYSKDIRELASLMNSFEIFISADCGMMHLASASQIPVVGLFRFDNLEKYQPYGNNSIGLLAPELEIEKVFPEIDKILKKND